jgi:hypothetical protein
MAKRRKYRFQTNQCIECGRTFESVRIDAKFDTANCRKIWWRRKRRVSKLESSIKDAIGELRVYYGGAFAVEAHEALARIAKQISLDIDRAE